MNLQEICYQAGQVIIRQGEEGDYYYVIKKGQVLITRKPSANAKEIKLAQLGDLDTFGEDALISGEPRNVTITALNDITLLRLEKEQFLSQIKQPILKYVSFKDALDYVAKGADLIDVRGPDEYKQHHLPRSINVPIFSLRMYLRTLNRHHPIIVVCNDGRASETAAFILLRNKFTALILKGGMAEVKAEQLQAPASFNIDDGVETANYKDLAQEEEFELAETDSIQQTTSLTANDSELRTAFQQLKLKYKELEAENLSLELKCTALARHLQAAKAEIEKLKGGG